MQLKLTSTLSALSALILILLPVLFPISGTTGSDAIAAMGRFHILVLHFPIGLLLIVPVLELLSRIGTLKYLREASQVILSLDLLFAFTACILGYMLASGEGISGSLLTQHMWLGITSTALVAVSLVLKTRSLERNSTAAYSAYLAALAASILTLTIGSHDGASMVHGKEYLYAKLPPPLQTLITGKAMIEKGITTESVAYDSVIKPIFEEHCYVCHSAAKDKGGFRMDDFEKLLSGGDGGMPGIEPGSPEESEVHYRITLKTTSKAFMPPDGRTPLNEDQVALITWWIENGASPTAPISALSHPPAALNPLLSGSDKSL